jgi:adenosine 3'-phospho 5'-phosphosulfate transporter B3
LLLSRPQQISFHFIPDPLKSLSERYNRDDFLIAHLSKFESKTAQAWPMLLSTEPHLFGFPVSHWPKWLILLIGAGGVFLCFLLDGIAHEHLIKHYHFHGTFFLTFFQFLGYSALSFPTAIRILTGKLSLRAPFISYLTTAVALAFSMSLTNFASVRLSYATGVLFKSSKLIPVLIGNVIFLKKRPKVSEVISVILIVFGLVGMSLGDFRGQNKFQISGIFAVSFALVCGAVASNLEDKTMSYYGASQDEVISMIYTIGAVVMFGMAVVTGESGEGLRTVMEKPSSIFVIFIFSTFGALGIQFVYLMMKVFGSLVTVMVTSVRKALTVCLSFVLFRDKVFTRWHAMAMIAIAAGMSLNISEKIGAQKTPQTEEEQHLLGDVGKSLSESMGEDNSGR